ncbi:MAG: family 16 glycosylhydrolase [Rikenellaceae bacterium]
MIRKLYLSAALIAACSMNLLAQPAQPEAGMRWVINPETSDEFEQAGFDYDKWYNVDPNSWRGRAPGFFEAEATSIADGKLRLTVDILEKPIMFGGQEFTHRGAHVYSKAKLLPGSYAECSMKANKTFMSSTFWLITAGKDREGCDSRTTELDIQECIGFPADNHTIRRMGSNTHSRDIPEGCNYEKGSKGNNAVVDGDVTEDFHTYAAWWKSPTEIIFYLDGEYAGTVNPAAPFDLPMAVKLVCETYNWSKAPEDGGMTGSFEDRTTSYEWVRCYTSIPIDQKLSKGENAYNSIFEEGVSFVNGQTNLSAANPKINVCYSSSKGGKLSVEIKSESGECVASERYSTYSGMGNVPFEFSAVDAGKYQVVATSNGKSAMQSVDIK